MNKNRNEIKEAKKQYRNLKENATQRWLEIRIATLEMLQRFYKDNSIFSPKTNQNSEIQINLMK